MENKKERRIYLWLLFVLCLVSFGLGFWCFKITDFEKKSPVPENSSLVLDAKPIVSQDITVQNKYVGFVESIHQVQIVPYISGYLQDIYIKPGQFVKKDTPLLMINPDEYQAQLKAAQASVLREQASVDYNLAYYKRVQDSGAKAFSDMERDNAKNNYKQAVASLKNAEANLAAAQVNLGYTFIRAPISGLVGNFSLSAGDYVSPSSGVLLDIVQTNPIRVVFSLTDTEYFDLLQKDEALFKNCVIQIRTADGKLFEHNGTFKYTDNKINKSTNSLAVYAYFQNDKNELLPNSFVTVEVTRVFKNTVSVDKSFIKMKPSGNYLNILRHNMPLTIKAEIIADNGNQYILKNTFLAGDLLLLSPAPNTTGQPDFKINIIN